MHAHDSPTSPKIRRLHPAIRATGRPASARPRPLFFVQVPAGRELPASDELDEHLRRWIMRELSGWVQLVILELLDDGTVEWHVDAVHGAAGRLIAVRCVDRRGPRRPGLWAALSIAAALAEQLGGVVLDPRRGTAVFGAGEPLRPPADARVHAIDHLCVPSSRGLGRRRWLSTVGLAHFGLPDLELVDVPEPTLELGARLLLGVAQHLIDSSWAPPSSGDHRREALLTMGELHWALGGEPGSVPSTRGRGWTRVALEFDGGRAWPELLRLGPPLGARRWRDPGAWIRDAWADLFGPPPAVAPALRASAS
jgi:hypothetical protein